MFCDPVPIFIAVVILVSTLFAVLFGSLCALVVVALFVIAIWCVATCRRVKRRRCTQPQQDIDTAWPLKPTDAVSAARVVRSFEDLVQRDAEIRKADLAHARSKMCKIALFDRG